MLVVPVASRPTIARFPAARVSRRTPTKKDAAFSDPTRSPDGSAVAFHDPCGVDVLRFSGFGANHCEITSPPTGSRGRWERARLRSGESAGGAQRRACGWQQRLGLGLGRGVGAGPGSSASSDAGDGKDASRSGVPSATVTVRPGALTTAGRRRAVLRCGFVAGHAGRVAVRVSSARTAIATGQATAKRAGVVTVRLSKASSRGSAGAEGSPQRAGQRDDHREEPGAARGLAHP